MIDKEEWNKFILENNGLFLQSWEWGEFQKSVGKKVWRIGNGENWLAQIIKHELPLGKSYLYCPGGPILKISNFQFLISNKIFEKLIEEIKKIAKQENAVFLKVEPLSSAFCHSEASGASRRISSPMRSFAVAQDDITKSRLTKSSGIQRIEKTLVLDLTKTEEQLLAEMKQKTRYNIRLAERQEVKIRISADPKKEINDFYKLIQETAERNRIRAHEKDYYLKQIITDAKQILTDHTDFRLFLAEYDSKIIAANIVVFFGNRAIYLHGGSSNEDRNLMAPYLLQWVQIQEAKKRGCEIYDFWGIDEEKWPGITRFKKGFGGNEIEYSGAFDYVFQEWWYGIYKFVKNFKNQN